MQTQQIHCTFHFGLYVSINLVMVTKQLNDNNVAIRMLSLRRFKKLNDYGYGYGWFAYLQRKTA